ncbi:MAG: DUF58 domain-containing protein [Casimicrobiaceae bacterium]
MFQFRSKARAPKGAPAAQPPSPAPGAPALAPGARRRVDPDALLRRLEWTVIRRLDGLLQGDYRTLLRGFGLDFADLREYQPHDDVRYIDWNVTARMDTPYVREFQEDREIAAWFLLDLSGSVDFGSREVKKRELSMQLVSVLARLLTRYGNRVGAILYGGGVLQVVPAASGRRQVLHVLDAMQRLAVPDNGTQTDLTGLLKKAEQVIKRRSAIFVVSDFISTPGWERSLSLLARRHEVVAVRLFDPMERELPDLGLVVLQDAETGEQIFVDLQDGGFRRRFQEQAATREEALRAGLGRAGVDCLELATDDELGEALLRFTGLRKRRSQLASGNVRQRALGAD